MKHIINLKRAKNLLFYLLFIGVLITSCKSTGQGIKKDYNRNKEKVGESVEEAGENMQENK